MQQVTMVTHKKDYPILVLGGLIRNLQTLEFFMRIALARKHSGNGFPLERNLTTLSVGDEISLNAITDYSTLKKVIRRYNSEVATTDEERISFDIVTLRDALAHGRVVSMNPDDPMTIIKFDNPQAIRIKHGALITFLKGVSSVITNWIRRLEKVKKEEASNVKVKVTFFEKMTNKWLEDKTRFVKQEILKVAAKNPTTFDQRRESDGRAVKQIAGQKFVNQKLMLDDNIYDTCTFDNCTLIYLGAGTVSFPNCTFVGANSFSFAAMAKNTLDFLAMINHQVPSGPRMVRDILEKTLRPSKKK